MENNETELFNEVYREISDVIGENEAVRFFELYRGQQITFPIHLYDARLIRERVSEEYDGKNAKELSKKYGYSEKTIRRMVKERKIL